MNWPSIPVSLYKHSARLVQLSEHSEAETRMFLRTLIASDQTKASETFFLRVKCQVLVRRWKWLETRGIVGNRVGSLNERRFPWRQISNEPCEMLWPDSDLCNNKVQREVRGRVGGEGDYLHACVHAHTHTLFLLKLSFATPFLSHLFLQCVCVYPQPAPADCARWQTDGCYK